MVVIMSAKGLVELLEVVTGERNWVLLSAVRRCEIVTAVRGLEVVASVFILARGLIERLEVVTGERTTVVVTAVRFWEVLTEERCLEVVVVGGMEEVTKVECLRAVVNFLLMVLLGMMYFLLQLVVETVVVVGVRNWGVVTTVRGW